MTFAGFPVAALDFYDDLEVDNTKTFWEEHRHVYDEAVKAPMVALTAALEDEFGPAKIFRPYRDVRFAKDKTPYKTHQGAFVAVAPSTGYYVQVGAPGVRTGVGFYQAPPARLASFREAVDHETFGIGLQRILGRLERQGWTVGGDAAKTAPRGWSADHPRIDLLRHRSLTLGRDHGFEPYVHTAELLDHVRADWRAGKPFIDWILTHVRG
ncbi:uncharacterized protein (TIGR02453 family) [Aeromicrobium sp. SORGH_AS981]|uniref:DUF2461 domain-containing protein n=1 Tax=Aeromicrobium sp. SORGH_AS_0981 TaxID=3041802 RepID=UPI00285FF84E|nr:DUF2461 domain-containing protein [Aeromicrobium sp. SORGH_AS_0981]MDR6120151.1 uncharacterized protein (TIGR02453 family) [Aeromicrobium sp. SORGH_AS_0981]